VLRIDLHVLGREDRAAALTTPTGHLLVVADGAGGTGDGAHAADAVLAAATAAAPTLTSAAACADLLTRLDSTLRRGETTAVLVVLQGDTIHGASVGDSGAWLLGPDSLHDLSEHQRRKPLLGSGRATATPFTASLGPATLLLATDGLFNYCPPVRIATLANTPTLEGLATRLCDLPRLRSGALPDDIAVILARR